MVEGRDGRDGDVDVDPIGDGAVPISVAARRVGLSADTLRIWERRYGLGPSRTSPGGHRRYDGSDLRRLRAAVQLLRSGVPAGEAVRAVLAATTTLAATPASDVHLHLPADAHPAVHEIAAAALDLDGPSVRRLLGAELAAHGVITTWEGTLRPLLAEIGEQWARVPYTIAVEHLVSHVATAVLSVPAGLVAGDGARPVLLACVPHEEHELPMTALAAALGERGVPATLLGPGTPAGTIRTAACATAGTGPTACTLVLFAAVPEYADPTLLRGFPSSVRLVAAGPGWHDPDVARTATRTDDLADAVGVVLGP